MRRVIFGILLSFTLCTLSAVQSLSVSLTTKNDSILCNSTIQIEKNGRYAATIGLKGDVSNRQTLLELQGKFAYHWPTISLYGGLLTNKGAVALLFDSKTAFAFNAGSSVGVTTPSGTATTVTWQGVMLSCNTPHLRLKIIPFGFVPLLGNKTPSGGGVVLLGETLALGVCHLSQYPIIPERYHINYFELAPSHLTLAVLAFSTPRFTPLNLQFILGTFSQAVRVGFSSQRGYYTSLVQELSLKFWDLQLFVNRCYEAPYPLQASTNQNERPFIRQSFSLQLPVSPWHFSLKGEQELFRRPIYANQAQKRRDTLTAHMQYSQEKWNLAVAWSQTVRWSQIGSYTHSGNVHLSLSVGYKDQHLQIALKGNPKELLKSQLAIEWRQGVIAIITTVRYIERRVTLALQWSIQTEQCCFSVTEKRVVEASFTGQRRR